MRKSEEYELKKKLKMLSWDKTRLVQEDQMEWRVPLQRYMGDYWEG